MTSENNQHVQLPPLNHDEIDLLQIASALSRHKYLIGGITLITLLLSGIFAFTRKPVWEGQFQIVLEDQDDSGGRLAQLAGAADPFLANLAGLGNSAGKSSLATEVKILESPSVLKPVHDFVKSSKNASGLKTRKWIYTDWVKDSLTIELSKGLLSLNLKYQDTDKALILPVLEKITAAYQEYSNRDSAKSLNNALRFAAEQSKILKERAKDSNRKLDAFKFTYGINDNAGEIESLSSPLPQVSKVLDPLAELAAINKELTKRLQFFTEADPSVERLQKEREAILLYINQTGGGLISIASGGTKEFNREILLNYKELQRTAMRDSAALTAMESELLSLQIQKAQSRQPWELISTPTILDEPVAPNKKLLLALGLVGGLVLGSGTALLIDLRKDLIYSEDELRRLCHVHLSNICRSTLKNPGHVAADLIAAGPLSELSGSNPVGLIPLGNVPNEQLQAFSTELNRALNGRELIVSTDLRQTSRCFTQLLITSPGVATRAQLSQIIQKLALQGTPLAGWVLLETNQNLG